VSSTTFKKRDLNRWKKTYPFVKRTPRWAYLSDLNFQMEVAEVNFDYSVVEQTYVYTCDFPPPPATPPVVTAIAMWTDDGGEPGANVNVTMTEVNHESCTIHVSNPFNGSVMIHIIWIDCPE